MNRSGTCFYLKVMRHLSYEGAIAIVSRFFLHKLAMKPRKRWSNLDFVVMGFIHYGWVIPLLERQVEHHGGRMPGHCRRKLGSSDSQKRSTDSRIITAVVGDVSD